MRKLKSACCPFLLVGFRRASRVDPKLLPSAEARGDQATSSSPAKTQFVLVAATLPSYGLKSINSLVQKAFPNAVRVTADHMHRQHPALRQEWVHVQDDKDIVDRGDQFMKIFTCSCLALKSAIETDQTLA